MQLTFVYYENEQSQSSIIEDVQDIIFPFCETSKTSPGNFRKILIDFEFFVVFAVQTDWLETITISGWLACGHWPTGNFVRGDGEPFAQKFSQVAHIFTKQSKKKNKKQRSCMMH